MRVVSVVFDDVILCRETLFVHSFERSSVASVSSACFAWFTYPLYIMASAPINCQLIAKCI